MKSPTMGSWFGEYTPHDADPDPRKLAVMVETDLAEIGRGRFPRAYEPMIVPLASYRSLLAATQRLLELHRRAVQRLGADNVARVAALKADPRDYPRFGPDPAFEIEHSIDVSRSDVVIAEDGPKFVELNVGAGIGGILEFELDRRIWERVRRESGVRPLPAPSLYGLLADLVKRVCSGLGISPAALLISSLLDPGKTKRYMDTQIALLAEHGVHASFADLSSLREVVGSSDSAGLIGIVQFAEREANANGWDMTPLSDAVNAGLIAVPSQTARLLDSKKVLALLSEGFDWMTEDELGLVRRYVPWSRVVGDRTVVWQGRTHELPELLLDRPECFVLKGAAGYSSQEVFFGSNTPTADWKQLVTSAVESEYYIAQEVVTPLRHPLRALLDQDGTIETVSANPRVCPFSVGGVPTGCYMRFDPSERIGPVGRANGAWPGIVVGAPS